MPAPTPSRPRVAVIDDGSQTRQTFHLAYPALDVVSTHASVEDFLGRSVELGAYDLVVLDLMLRAAAEPVLQGSRAIKELTGRGLRVCLYSDERRLLVIAQCLSAGASGLVRKSDPLADNETAFLRAAAGQTIVPRSLTGLAELLARRHRLPELTDRQIEVLTARARGETWEALARRLHISPKTAYDRLEAVMMKMVWFLRDVDLPHDATPGDVERALGLAPGDLQDPA